jgi:hypothetical protein
MEHIIRNIVGRCHVGDGYLSVIRYAISRLRRKRRGFLALSRPQRREFLRLCINTHAENRRVYISVMTGRRIPAFTL